MKKFLAKTALLFGICMLLAGCAKKMTIYMIVDGIGDYDIVSLPTGTVNCAVNDNVISVTVRKNGDYDFVLKGDDGENHTITLKYNDGKAEAEAEEGISVNLGSGAVPTMPGTEDAAESEGASAEQTGK